MNELIVYLHFLHRKKEVGSPCVCFFTKSYYKTQMLAAGVSK